MAQRKQPVRKSLDGVQQSMPAGVNLRPLLDVLLKNSFFLDRKARDMLFMGLPGQEMVARSDIPVIDMQNILEHVIMLGQLSNGSLALDVLYNNLRMVIPENTQLANDTGRLFEILRSSLVPSQEKPELIDSPPRKPRRKTSKPETGTERPPAETASDRLNYLETEKPPTTETDNPFGPDRLNYHKYAQSLVSIILNPETSTPLTVAIYGQWGQGKSFLMGKIYEYLLITKIEQRSGLRFRLPWNVKNASSLYTAIIDQLMVARLVEALSSVFEQVVLGIEKLGLYILEPERFGGYYWPLRRPWKRFEPTVDFLIVHFNAWSYVATDHLWAGLITQLYQAVEAHFGNRVVFARFWEAIKRSLPKSLAIILFYGFLGVGLSLLIDFNQVTENWTLLKVAVNAFGASILGGSALASLPLLLSSVKDFVDTLFIAKSKDLQKLTARPDFKAQIGIMADIKEELLFINKLLTRRRPATRVFLFIDDLDRCDHRKAVEVLQAVMLLTGSSNSPYVVFMGIDARVVIRAIEQTYGDVLIKAGINGYEYLDKIVQLPFVIPEASQEELRQYVNSMTLPASERTLLEKYESPAPANVVSQSPGDGGAGQTTQAPETPLPQVNVTFTKKERTALDRCAKDFIRNPRKVKRIINIYRFAKLLLPPEQDRLKAIHWFLMTEQWPLHIAWILEHIENDMQTKNQLKSKSLADVYRLAKRDICSKEMESLLPIDADPDRFEAFIRENNFSVEEIVKLLPFTFNLNPAIRSEVSKRAARRVTLEPDATAKSNGKSAG